MVPGLGASDLPGSTPAHPAHPISPCQSWLRAVVELAARRNANRLAHTTANNLHLRKKIRNGELLLLLAKTSLSSLLHHNQGGANEKSCTKISYLMESHSYSP